MLTTRLNVLIVGTRASRPHLNRDNAQAQLCIHAIVRISCKMRVHMIILEMLCTTRLRATSSRGQGQRYREVTVIEQRIT
jgi:hypothetical protein